MLCNMLSILIPVYNNDVIELVQDLHVQSKAQNIAFEIIVVDDASKQDIKHSNKQLQKNESVYYEELSENVGRSRIRNYLAEKANYDTLIFLDGDSQISENPNFISTYIGYIKSSVILNGGRIYSPSSKTDKTILHYTYGSKKECPTIEKRNKFPTRFFHSNNFMVKKALLIDYPFPDMKTGYGYEDLVFATAIENANMQIKHIENPVEHQGLISSEQFIENIHAANTNLLDFHNSGDIIETPLLKTYNRLKKIGLLKPVRYILSKLNRHLESNLKSKKPSLFYLDLYKLNDFIKQATVRR